MESKKIFQRYQDLQRYVGWTDQDAKRVQRLKKILLPQLQDLVNDFYNEIMQHEHTSKIITGGQAQIDRLKKTLALWVEQLLTGPYDSTYVQQRTRAGQRHVEIGLEQVYTNAALSRMRNRLQELIEKEWSDQQPLLAATLRSLNKLLDLDLAIIEDAYETAHLLRQQQIERQRSETTFRNLVETAGCMIVILRDDSSIAYFNSFAELITGYSAVDMIGGDFLKFFVSEEDRKEVSDRIQKALKGKPVHGFEHNIKCSNDLHRAIVWNVRRLDHYDEKPVVLVVGQDITSLKEAQEQALQSERLAAIGQMSTGLAHESRNALQRIQACSEMLELEVEDNEDALELIRRIQKAQDHMHRLLDEVRGYAAPLKLDRSECQLSGIWREAWELLNTQKMGRETHLVEEIKGVDLNCSVDHFRLVHLFRNMLENAIDACQDPVEIQIQCQETTLAGKSALRVLVSDNGPGFTPEQQDRILEPFFTTKPKGTGLGMAIVQRTVEAHEGVIEIGNGSQGGAEIKITLPRE